MERPSGRPVQVHNLPPEPTPFIGRVDEIAEICRLLSDPACRLLTVVGPGGIGKTRLAVQAAIALAGDLDLRPLPETPERPQTEDGSCGDGIYFVPLQPIPSVDFLASAVADALKFPLTGHKDPVAQLLDSLHDRQILLLLDNFEHLLAPPPSALYNKVGNPLSASEDAMPLSSSPGEATDRAVLDVLSDILNAGPGVKLLVTSREVLNLQEEWVYQVPGLSYPELPASAGLAGEKIGEDIAAYSALQLFLERARRVRRDFSLADEAAGVLRICQLVAGMPLAIELAASWTRTMPCSVIAAEIQHNIRFLATSLRNVPERQRSMWAVFDQSWRLLKEQERGVFKRLSVFHDSFDRAAAQHIAGASLVTLAALADKSLLRPDPNGRYYIHELLRQYAALQLAQSPEDVAHVYDFHCAYYADFLHARQEDMAGARQQEAAAEIKAELENIRAAWQWAAGMSKVEEIQKATQALSWFYQFQSRYLEAATAFEKAMHSLKREPAAAQTDLALVDVLVQLAWFYIRLGRLEEAEAVATECRTMYDRLDLPPVPGQASDPRLPLAIIAAIRGDYVTATRLGEEARQVSEARHDHGNLPFALYVLATASLAEGDLAAARQYAQRACAILEETGERWFMAYCLNELGNVARAQGDYATARQHFQASYAIRQAFDDPEGMAVALNHLGKIALLQENYAEAEERYRDSLTIYRQIGDRGGLATSLNGLAATACALGNYLAACQYFREALEIASDIHFVPLILSNLVGIGQLLVYARQPERGVELLALTRYHPASERETRDWAQHFLDRYQAQLAPDLFSAAVQRGQSSDLETVTATLQAELAALEFSPEVAPPARTRPSPPPPQPLAEPLTARELEVLQLVADGLTNQQIAQELIISTGTVKFYTSQIYGKLNVSSRTQAVARSRDLGLL
jgi:predicted ATPase/DNA-binding CsgD family transcriptional regulator